MKLCSVVCVCAKERLRRAVCAHDRAKKSRFLLHYATMSTLLLFCGNCILKIERYKRGNYKEEYIKKQMCCLYVAICMDEQSNHMPSPPTGEWEALVLALFS